MSKTSLAFNEANLVIMGLYDTVYDTYVSLQVIYNSAIEQLGTTKISFPRKADDACRSQVRKVLESFLSRHTSFFSKDYDTLHVNAHGLNGFSMLDVRHGEKPLQIVVRFITFHSFLEELFNIVVRIIAQRRNRQYPESEIDIVFEEVNQHIESLAAQYRKRIPVTQANGAISIDAQLFVYSQFSLISCSQKKHTVVSDTLCVEKLDGTGFYILPIHCCTTCGRKFVGEYTLDYYQREYGKIRVNAQKDYDTDHPTGFTSLRLESELHSHGYNVVEGQLSESERRDLLIQLLQSGEMTYFEISRDIKNSIHTQQHLPFRAPALAKWKSDLEFLSKYIDSHSEYQ